MRTKVVGLLLAPVSPTGLEALPEHCALWITSGKHMQPTFACARALSFDITELFPQGVTTTEWLFNHLDSVGQHHNEYSQQPPYNSLLVFGVTLTPAVALFLKPFGFVAPRAEAFGFSAIKQLNECSAN